MRLLVIATLLAAGAGCKDEVDAAFDEFASYRDRACACTDLACVVRVEDEWRARALSLRQSIGKANGPQSARALEIAKEMLACKERLLANATGRANDGAH